MKDVRRRQFHPLTDGKCQLVYHIGHQATRIQCEPLGPTPLTGARFPLTGRLLRYLPLIRQLRAGTLIRRSTSMKSDLRAPSPEIFAILRQLGAGTFSRRST